MKPTIKPEHLLLFFYLCAVPAALGNDVNDALKDMSDVQQSDAGGYTLMIISIGMLFVIVTTLIGVTTWYMMKSKRSRTKL